MDQELKKCSDDFFYFCEKYVKINSYNYKTKERGVVNFVLYDYQKRYIEEWETYGKIIGKKFKGAGFTFLPIVYLLWRAMFHQGKNLYIDKSDRWIGSYLSWNIKDIWNRFPDWLMLSIKKWNDHTIEFENGSEFKLLSTSSLGEHVEESDYIVFDESAFWWQHSPHPSADDIWSKVRDDAKVSVISSANGSNNWFYRTYTEAEKNGLHVYACKHSEHPHYDTEFETIMQAMLGEKGYRQEVLMEFISE